MALRKYTMVGRGQAKAGCKFMFKGPAEACKECEGYGFCVEPLEPGRIYRVKHVTFKRFPCGLHGSDARLVEVEESIYDVNLESRTAVLNALITFQPVECGQPCPHRGRCFPDGLVEGDRCRVVEVGVTVHCPLGRKLSSARLQRLPGGE
jgi:uncharacterized protein (UPF0179 family)